ncbi:MAG: MBL fold metallo-hydrolase [Sutterella sp.]|nr:MBL fold metallo-hydrolase [Sutterella sp.]
MNRKQFLQLGLSSLFAPTLVGKAMANDAPPMVKAPVFPQGKTAIQMIRNATLRVSIGGVVFLVDPMLSKKHAFPGFPLTYNHEQRNPMRDLPMSVEDILKADAILLTHTHEDHWDEAARQMVPKAMPIYVNDEKALETVKKAGFTNVKVLAPKDHFKGVTIYRVASQHGPDEFYETAPADWAEMLGTTVGFVLEAPGTKKVYIAGDTVWQPAVTEALRSHRPDVVVLNTGAAMSSMMRGSMIMDAQDFLRAYNEAPFATIVAVHMDAINHCTLHRSDLRQFRDALKMDAKRALIPEDGELMVFA